MIDTVYIEQAVIDHPRTHRILQRFPDARQIICERYTEIFNRKSQNFRLQKKQPALILAKKFKQHVLPVPGKYSLGAHHNYYFSHMLNCIYDCRYCFLQGMFRSAHYVLFVNYEDFFMAIDQKIKQHGDEITQFFSGYDCDSLALEPVTNFIDNFLPMFEDSLYATLELRTKSTQIRPLLERKALNNIVVAWSFTPDNIANALEHKTPSVDRRIEAMLKLQEKGWSVGLRFDPLIYDANFHKNYEVLFKKIFDQIDINRLHSVSLGSFRLPRDYFRTIHQLYPDEILFASPLEENNGITGYKRTLEREMLDYCSEKILSLIPDEKFFPCHDVT